MSIKKTIVIVGGGASAIACAAHLDQTKYHIHIFEKNKALGRKLLVAGKGGFNLTHSEKVETFIKRYTPADFLKKTLLEFSNDDLLKWLEEIGIPTYVGSSKRVYPLPGIKPVEVLKAMENVLEQKSVQIHFNKTWLGWENSNRLVFQDGETIETDYVVFALGGGSWSVTGSDGSWLSLFKEKGIKTTAFQASNCAYKFNWKNDFINQYAGSPLKNIAISCENTPNKWQKGEVVITQFGLEGNAIYALSPIIRKEIALNGKAKIYIDFKPSLSLEDVQHKLLDHRHKNISLALKLDLKLSPAQIAVLKTVVSKDHFINASVLAEFIKKVPLTITGSGALNEAISTVGGISLDEVSNNFELKAMKNHYCIGELLDWDAPTGGYLLQACFSMGVHLAKHFNEKTNETA